MRTDNRSKYRFILGGLSLIIGLWAAGAVAAPTTADQARQAVARWLSFDSQPLQTPLGRQVDRVETYRNAQSQPLYHIVYLTSGGFVIVPGDDRIEPIIGFAAGGTFDPSPDNPLGCLVSHDMAERMAAAGGAGPKAAPASLVSRAQGKWNRLLGQAAGPAAAGLATISDVRVAPLVQSKWNQDNVSHDYCYNYYTPNHYVCGCTATAMAQIMRFHQHPTTGIGVHPFTVTVDDTSQDIPTRGGDGNGGAYDWNNMPLVPEAGLTEVQRQAIGALCHDAGVAAHMHYTAGGSGAYLDDARNAFVGVFKYANAIRAYRNDLDLGTWLSDIANANFDAGHPILLEIRDDSGDSRHAIVADGYGYDQATLYRHLNYGWAGSADSWYNLPDMGAGYSAVCGAVYNIFTTGTGEIISGRVLDPGGNPVSGATVTATLTGGGTYTATTNAKGIYALAKVPSASTFVVTATKTGHTFAPRTVTTGTSLTGLTASGNRWGIDFDMPLLPPTVLGIEPASGGNLESQVLVTISGTGFLPFATVKLARAGQSDIVGTGVTVDGPTRIRCVFNLTGAVPGPWNVVLQDLENQTASLNDGFTIFQQYTLTTGAVGSGTVQPTAGKYAAGSQVSVTATPTMGYRVRRWNGSDNDSLTTRSNTVTMTSNKWVTVEFEVCPKRRYTGSVSAGRGTLDPLSGSYPEGTRLTLTATPAAGYRMLGWTGTDNDSSTELTNTVTLDTDRSVTVAFGPDPNWRFELVTRVIGDHGTILPGPIQNFVPGTVVDLTAVPDEGYCVKEWTGTDNNQSTASTNTVTMDRNRTVTVEFRKAQVRMQTQVVGGNGKIWPVGGAYDVGLSVLLTAHPDPGFRVKRWTGTDSDDSTESMNTVTMTTEKTVTVEFEAIPDWQQPTPTPVPGSTTDIQPMPDPITGCGAGGIGAIVLVLLSGLGIVGRRP